MYAELVISQRRKKLRLSLDLNTIVVLVLLWPPYNAPLPLRYIALLCLFSPLVLSTNLVGHNSTTRRLFLVSFRKLYYQQSMYDMSIQPVDQTPSRGTVIDSLFNPPTTTTFSPVFLSPLPACFHAPCLSCLFVFRSRTAGATTRGRRGTTRI